MVLESSEEDNCEAVPPPAYILPEPWEAVLQPEDGVYYYWNPDTEESTWEPPQGAIPVADPSPGDGASADADAAGGAEENSRYKLRPRRTSRDARGNDPYYARRRRKRHSR